MDVRIENWEVIKKVINRLIIWGSWQLESKYRIIMKDLQKVKEEMHAEVVELNNEQIPFTDATVTIITNTLSAHQCYKNGACCFLFIQIIMESTIWVLKNLLRTTIIKPIFSSCTHESVQDGSKCRVRCHNRIFAKRFYDTHFHKWISHFHWHKWRKFGTENLLQNILIVILEINVIDYQVRDSNDTDCI